MKKVRWIIQDNLIAENDLKQLQEACNKLGLPFQEITVVPFSAELPDFPIDNEYENIYYGSTTLMNNIYEQLDKPVGLFYNHETFSMENYIEKWGEHMLNCDASLTYVNNLIKRPTFYGPLDKQVFVRPDGDGKEFDGQVGTILEISEMLKRTLEYEGPMTKDSKILIGPAYNIHREWRNYCVNGKVITSSRYRNNFRLSKSGLDIPTDMITFVEDRLAEYQPHDVIAVDIAEVMDDGVMKYYIIECGCMNSVGFYASDIFDYVHATSNYIKNL